MGNALKRDGTSSNYRWDALFQALTRPSDLRKYLETMVPQESASEHGPLRTQIELLTGTLQVDMSLLKVAEVAESFDTATFCLGQLVSHEPKMISELSFAHSFVDGLSCALRKGWLVHHGVGKFAANALTILCICEQANRSVRERAIDELLGGLLAWLQSDEAPEEVDEVCGCNCGCPALSATCWLEVRRTRQHARGGRCLRGACAHHARPALATACHLAQRHDRCPPALYPLLRAPSLSLLSLSPSSPVSPVSIEMHTDSSCHLLHLLTDSSCHLLTSSPPPLLTSPRHLLVTSSSLPPPLSLLLTSSSPPHLLLLHSGS